MHEIEKGVNDYFSSKLSAHGNSPMGVDWNSKESQYQRFEQLFKLIDPGQPFSVLDYGCGTGELVNFLDEKNGRFEYTGFDIVTGMIEKAKEIFAGRPAVHFTSEPVEGHFDYVVESGIFNIRQSEYNLWSEYVLSILHKMNQYSTRGFAFNLLTSYSDPEYMKDYLFYADPCKFFDYCKRNFSRNVALLHDYNLYDFTIIVRK